VQGWNWIAFTGNTPTLVNDAMANYSAGDATNEDELKSQTGSATFYIDTWYAQDFMLRPGLGYKLKVQKANPSPFTFSE